MFFLFALFILLHTGTIGRETSPVQPGDGVRGLHQAFALTRFVEHL